jgi:hypothetical protein
MDCPQWPSPFAVLVVVTMLIMMAMLLLIMLSMTNGTAR